MSNMKKEMSDMKNEFLSKNKLIVAVVVLSAILLLIAQNFLMEKKISKAQMEAYNQALAEASGGPTPLDISPTVHAEAATLLEAIQEAKELVSYKYYYEAVGDYTKDKKFFNTKISVPFTKDKSIFTYRGTMSAGIDLNGLVFDVDNDHKVISVSLPEPSILSHEFEIDSFKVYDIKNSIFTSTKLSDYAGLEAELKDLQETKLEDNEDFWENVRSNIELVLANLLRVSGQIDGYLLQFHWNK